MNLTNDSINKLLGNDFSLDFIKIKLTQNIPESPIVYSGPGTIYQDKNGIIKLKLYHKLKDVGKEVRGVNIRLIPGQILGDEQYFSLSAVDMLGNKWISDNIYIREHISIPAAGKVVEADLKYIVQSDKRSTSADKNKSHLHILVKGGYDIPANKKEDLPGGGWHLNTTEISNDKYKIVMNARDSYLNINLSSSHKIFKEDLHNILTEALSIIFGKYVKPIAISYSHKNIKKTIIYSAFTKIKDGKIAGPINHRIPGSIAQFQEFIEKYLDTFHKPSSDYFGYWLRIFGGWRSGIENAALSICVAIEGIVKNHHSNYGDPDDEFLSQAKVAIEKLQDLEIPKRAKNRLMSSLTQAISSNPKTALFNLSKAGWFDKKLATTWASLRNSSTHADNVELHDEYIQEYINQTYICLQLFYSLLFIKIGYNNKYYDFTKTGWPEVQFRTMSR